MSRKAIRINQHLKLLSSTTHRNDLRHTRNCQQAGTDHPFGKGPNLHRRCCPVTTVQSDHHDLTHDGTDRCQFRLYAGWHTIQYRRDPFVDDLSSQVNIRAPAKFDVHDRQPDSRRTSHGLDSRRSVQSGFQWKCDECLYFFRSQSRAFGHHDDAWPRQTGKDIDRQSCHRDRTKDQRHQREANNQQSILQGETNECIHQ